MLGKGPRGSEEGRAEKEFPPRKPPRRAAYPVHLEAGTGPMVNPFPLTRHRRALVDNRRVTTRWSRWVGQRRRPVSAEGVGAGAAVHPGRAVRCVVRAAEFTP